MISAFLTKAFWVKSLEWCKINWKFLLGISIPIIISILLRRGNAAKIYKKASETRKKQLDVLNEVDKLESSQKQKAQEEFISTVEDVTNRHEEALRLVVDNEREILKNIDSAEKATEAIKKKSE